MNVKKTVALLFAILMGQMVAASDTTKVAGNVTYSVQRKAVAVKPAILCNSSYTIIPG